MTEKERAREREGERRGFVGEKATKQRHREL